MSTKQDIIFREIFEKYAVDTHFGAGLIRVLPTAKLRAAMDEYAEAWHLEKDVERLRSQQLELTSQGKRVENPKEMALEVAAGIYARNGGDVKTLLSDANSILEWLTNDATA